MVYSALMQWILCSLLEPYKGDATESFLIQYPIVDSRHDLFPSVFLLPPELQTKSVEGQNAAMIFRFGTFKKMCF